MVKILSLCLVILNQELDGLAVSKNLDILKRFRFFLLAYVAGVLFRSRNRHVEFQKLRGIEAKANLEGCFFYLPNLYKHLQ